MHLTGAVFLELGEQVAGDLFVDLVEDWDFVVVLSFQEIFNVLFLQFIDILTDLLDYQLDLMLGLVAHVEVIHLFKKDSEAHDLIHAEGV